RCSRAAPRRRSGRGTSPPSASSPARRRRRRGRARTGRRRAWRSAREKPPAGGVKSGRGRTSGRDEGTSGGAACRAGKEGITRAAGFTPAVLVQLQDGRG